MIKRRIENIVQEALQRSPSVALMGPRQVGKTTIALNISESTSSIYLDLENRLDLDEVQRLPQVFAPLRGIIDKERRKGKKTGQFLFLGSASIDLLQQSSESLAGRIAYIELYPVAALEYAGNSLDKLNSLWLRGGFPESLLAKSDKDSMQWRFDFTKTYMERDIPQLGPRIPAETLERFWTMLAHNQGSVLNLHILQEISMFPV